MYRCLPSGYRTTLKRNKNYNSHMVFCTNSPKKWSYIQFFPFKFQRLQTIFWTIFGEKEIELFSAKIRYNKDHQFCKSWLKKKYIFFKWLLPFTEVKWLILSYFFPKNRKISRGMVSFFVWYQRFFTKKSFSG